MLENINRVIEQLHERVGFPGRLVLAGDEQRTVRNLIEVFDLIGNAADRAQEPMTDIRPRMHRGPQGSPTRNHEHR